MFFAGRRKLVGKGPPDARNPARTRDPSARTRWTARVYGCRHAPGRVARSTAGLGGARTRLGGRRPATRRALAAEVGRGISAWRRGMQRPTHATPDACNARRMQRPTPDFHGKNYCAFPHSQSAASEPSHSWKPAPAFDRRNAKTTRQNAAISRRPKRSSLPCERMKFSTAPVGQP